jgi:hypothetical protein
MKRTDYKRSVTTPPEPEPAAAPSTSPCSAASDVSARSTAVKGKASGVSSIDRFADRTACGRVLVPLLVAAAVSATLIGPTTSAHATVPGRNGPIVFGRFLDVAKTRAALSTVNPDGARVGR